MPSWRWRIAAQDTVEVYKEHPVQVAVFTVVIDAVAALGTYAVHQAGWAVAAAIVVGTAAVILIVFAWAFLTWPRRSLEFRVDSMQEQLTNQQSQLNAIIGHEWGPVDVFVPVYHDLRGDLEDAIRKVTRAQESGKLWSFTERLDDGVWKKNRDALGTHPWGKVDGAYGPCADAFGHVERLNTLRSVRWLRPEVRDSDDLDAALDSMEVAVAHLRAVVQKFNIYGSPEQLHLEEDGA